MNKKKTLAAAVVVVIWLAAFAGGMYANAAGPIEVLEDPIVDVPETVPDVETASEAEPAETMPEPAEVGPRWSPEVVAIARACVNETEWASVDPDREVNDCGAIAQVAIWQSEHHAQYRHEPLLAIQRMSRKSFDRSRVDGRRWVAWLNTDLTQPQGWYRGQSWDPQRWEAVLDNVASYFDGTEPLPCSEAPFHWGGPHPDVDGPRITAGRERGYWHPVNCGQTLNTFLAPNSVIARVARGTEHP